MQDDRRDAPELRGLQVETQVETEGIDESLQVETEGESAEENHYRQINDKQPISVHKSWTDLEKPALVEI